MSVIDIRPGHCDDGHDDTTQQLRQALHALPPASLEAVREQLISVVAHYEGTGDADPLVHFADSLLMTARLNRNPGYLRSVAEAEAEPVSADSGSVEDFMTRMQERYA